MNHGWIIDFDHLEHRPTRVVGPRNIPAEIERTLTTDRESGTTFRMRDDDGEIYYTGRFIGDHTSAAGFAPLEDFGTPDSGCTSIEYRIGRSWRVL